MRFRLIFLLLFACCVADIHLDAFKDLILRQSTSCNIVNNDDIVPKLQPGNKTKASSGKTTPEASIKTDVAPGEVPKQPIATFEEWTKEKLRQEVKRTEQILVASGSGAIAKPRISGSSNSRNYASKECGAKVIIANAEAENTKALLNDKEKDEYMRNPCETKDKFFVIELCETIQPQTIELGNFELFSSGPKGIIVSAAERFPTAEWTPILQVDAQDSRALQSFTVTKTGQYAKFLRVQLLSHYGKEHYCTLTMLRVLGMSIVEEYEAEAEIAAGRISAAAIATEAAAQSQTPKAEESVPSPKIIEKQPKKPTTVDPSNESNLNPGKLLKKIVNVVYEKFVPEKRSSPAKLRFSDACISCPTHRNKTMSVISKRFCQLIGFAVNDRIRYSKPNFELINYHMKRTRRRRLRSSFLERVGLARPGQTVLEPQASVVIPEKPKNATDATIAAETDVKNDSKEPNASVSEEPQLVEPAPHQTTTNAQIADLLPATSLSHKESVFMKLNKRIAALELNMSLSSEYLGELSRQYVAQAELQEQNIIRAKRIAEEAVSNATSRINVTLVKQLETMRIEVDELSQILRSARKESAILQLGIAFRAHKAHEDPKCAGDDDEFEDDSAIDHFFDHNASKDGLWTTEQVVYIVVGVQIMTAFLFIGVQICLRMLKPAQRLTSEDMHTFVDARIKELLEKQKTTRTVASPLSPAEPEPSKSTLGPAAKRRRRRKRQKQGETDSAVDSSLPTASVTHSDIEERERQLTALHIELQNKFQPQKHLRLPANVAVDLVAA